MNRNAKSDHGPAKTADRAAKVTGKTEASPPKETPATDRPFPIVGIGASAGGLEALEIFLRHVPRNSGIALVIVQHLDPTYKGIMVELLQRATEMPVVQVKDRLRVKPDHVYVIPPNKYMSILHGVLHLLDPVAPRGQRLSIDFFFRSLADDRRENSIGVILSGMGSDGTLGLHAIKEKAGVVFVQDPASAKFDGMPRSAVAAGLADVIAPAEVLPGKILAYLQYAPLISRPGLSAEDKGQSALDKVVILLRAQTGHDFSLYKKNTVYRRIERRMGIHQISKIADYVRFLQENPQELDLLFRELLIGVTGFFRDPVAWAALHSEVVPRLLAARTPNQALRVWVPACSTGEEAYSLAILFQEAIEFGNTGKRARSMMPRIFATDLDQDAIQKARDGVFPANIAADVTAERLSRFFIRVEHGYQICKSIREMVIFAPQNIIMDPPFTKLDLLSCRNLLIYLTSELQKKLLPLFHYSLNPGGYLFLGSSETVGGFGELFEPVNGRARVYRRLDSALPAGPIELPSTFIFSRAGGVPPPPKPAANLQTLADQLLLQSYAPAAVLTNDKGDILYISGRTGKYLEPAAGKANWNIFVMAREGLRHRLAGAFQMASRQKETVVLKCVVEGNNGGGQTVEVAVHPIQEPGTLCGMLMLVFHDLPAAAAAEKTAVVRPDAAHKRKLAELERDLLQARQEAKTVSEEMQTSQEELKSTNEELQTINEELQSTNEELTTSREEMQSLNEELQTINHELQAKVDELSRTNNDMKNLLDSTDIATLFLDNDLRVRRFTSQATKITKLIPGDIGRPITDIASEALYPELAEDVRQVLRTLTGVEKQVEIRDGRWFGARILPYRTLENMIDGAVITFTDITASKTLEAQLRTREARLQEMLSRRK